MCVRNQEPSTDSSTTLTVASANLTSPAAVRFAHQHGDPSKHCLAQQDGCAGLETMETRRTSLPTSVKEHGVAPGHIELGSRCDRNSSLVDKGTSMAQGTGAASTDVAAMQSQPGSTFGHHISVGGISRIPLHSDHSVAESTLITLLANVLTELLQPSAPSTPRTDAAISHQPPHASSSCSLNEGRAHQQRTSSTQHHLLQHQPRVSQSSPTGKGLPANRYLATDGTSLTAPETPPRPSEKTHSLLPMPCLSEPTRQRAASLQHAPGQHRSGQKQLTEQHDVQPPAQHNAQRSPEQQQAWQPNQPDTVTQERILPSLLLVTDTYASPLQPLPCTCAFPCSLKYVFGKSAQRACASSSGASTPTLTPSRSSPTRSHRSNTNASRSADSKSITRHDSPTRSHETRTSQHSRLERPVWR